MDPEISNRTQSRKLAAIVFTDLVGFSSLMGLNEKLALEVVRKNREIHQSSINNHGGQLLKEMGDGILASFPSALQSVECALEIQKNARDLNPELPIRIGIHLGDVNIENEDIYGDGVNIASRIQALADPGGIYITESVYNLVRNHENLTYRYLGEVHLKNISELVRTYALQGEGLPFPEKKRLASVIKKPSNLKVYRNMAVGLFLAVVIILVWFSRTYRIEKIVKPKSVAVLPLKILKHTQDPERDYLSSGMTDALIKELSKAGPLTVISRRSTRLFAGTSISSSQIANELNGVDYIVKGTLESSDNMLKAGIQLIDPEKNQILFQKDYLDDISNSIRMWANVSQDLVNQMNIKVPEEDAILWNDVRRVNPETYELYLKGMYLMEKSETDDQLQGMVYLNEAVDKNPADPYAYVGLAYGYITWGHSPNPRPGDWEKARAASLRALQLDSTLAEAWSTLADYKTYGENDWDGAERAFLKANELNPSLPMNHYHYAWYLALFGRFNDAIREHKRAKELDPLTPMHTAWLGELYNYVGEYEKAMVEARASMQGGRNMLGLAILGNAFLGKGMFREAVSTHEEVVEIVGPIGYFWLGPTYLEAGKIQEGKKILEELEEEQSPLFNLTKAAMYTQLGEYDQAFEILKSRPRHAWYPWIRISAFFEPIWEDTRFKNIMRELNLPDPAPFEYDPELHANG